MKTGFAILLLMCLVSITSVSLAQTDGSFSVTCDDGTSFDNGVEFIVNQMRPSFSYTATAVGLNGFDPVLAVLDENGQGLCNDDSDDAAGFTLDLPTTGTVRATERSAQVTFSQTTGNMADVSLVVGGYNNEPGEFVLILEGMAATAADGAGDPFSVRLSQPMVDSGVPLTTYMIGVVNSLDPLLYLADEELNPFIDDADIVVTCDDSGTNSCWGDSALLGSSFVSTMQGRFARADALDSMLRMPLDNFRDLDFNDDLYLTYVMTRATEGIGDYVIAFHASTSADGGQAEVTENSNQSFDNQSGPTGNPNLVGGISVTCDDGTSFDNGVEIIVNQMRSGFNYTATAIGIGEFDPILAILDANGRGLCNDDSDDALEFFVDLPSTGEVSANARSAQLVFSQNMNDMVDVSLVVGGFNSEPGEFVLILEGMATTPEDGAGDPFSVQITPGLAGSDVELSAYMLGVVDVVDPVLYVADAELDPFIDDAGETVLCDDGGNESLCWGESFNLGGARVARTLGRVVNGDSTDAMLTVPMFEFADLDFAEGPFYVTFVMTRHESSGMGDYVIAFHAEAR